MVGIIITHFSPNTLANKNNPCCQGLFSGREFHDKDPAGKRSALCVETLPLHEMRTRFPGPLGQDRHKPPVGSVNAQPDVH